MNESLFDDWEELPDPRLGSPFRPGPGVMNIATKVGTEEARSAVYCALVDNDVLQVDCGIADPVNAAGLALSLDETTDGYVFIATALMMLAEAITKRTEEES